MKFMDHAEKYLQLIKLILLVSRSVDIESLRTKYGLEREKIMRIYVLDADKYYTLKVENGKLMVKMFDPKPDVTVVINQLCTFKHLRLGMKSGMDPATGAKCMLKYTPMHAWRMGDISSYGDSSTNDIVAAVNMFVDIVGNIPESEVERIIGGCEHD